MEPRDGLQGQHHPVQGVRPKRRFKKRYLALALVVSYVIVCQSCMTMRLTAKETQTFFDTLHVAFRNESVVISDHTLHYVETGRSDAPVLFFVHGSPGSWDAFRRYLSDPKLLAKYRMIAVDRPGFGYSDFGEAEELHTNAKLLESLLTTLDHGHPITLVGHSLGGPVVTQMAADEPNRFQNLVILAGSVDPKAETKESWRRVFLYKPIRYLVPGALRPSNDELWWLKGSLPDLQPKIRNIHSNVVIVHGTKDPLVPFRNVDFLKRELTGAKSVTIIPIEGANHFIPWEHYDEIRAVLLALQ